MNTTKEARRDAREYARAQMYYGDGAGVRRKLIAATVDAKTSRDPVYARAFHQELAHQDMAEHASAARQERLRKDRTNSISRNVKGLATGNYQQVQTGLLVGAVAVYFAHSTGFDKKIMAKGKELYAKTKSRFQHKETPQDRVTNIRNAQQRNNAR